VNPGRTVLRLLKGLIVVLVTGVLLSSCAGNDLTSPSAGNWADNTTQITTGNQSPNRAILGFWTFHVPTDRSTVEAIPMRGTEMHLNAVNLLESLACDDCLKIDEVFFTSSDVLHANVTITHPWPGMVKYTGFDVRGIVITGHDFAFPESNRKISWSGENVRMLYADGYTTLFNPTEYPVDKPGWPMFRYIPGDFAGGGDLTATLNPYVSYRDGDENNPRRIFAAGSSATETITLDLVPGDLEFGYAVDACWSPAEGNIADPEEDFPPDANCREAYVMFVTQGEGLSPIPGSSALINVEVWDHQGIDTVSTVFVEAPDLFDGAVELAMSTVTDEGVLYSSEISNEAGVIEGEYPLLVRVIDFDADENLGAIDAWKVIPVRVTESGYPICDLIHIDGGEFFMGVDPSNDPWPELYAAPGHMHPYDAFYIGKYEVTNAEFAVFITAGGYENPDWWSSDGWAWRLVYSEGEPMLWWKYEIGRYKDDWPVQVQFFEAEAFANWVGGRLPTEVEWERAARGNLGDHRVYPWGDEWDWTKCYNRENPIYCGLLRPNISVGSFSPPGDSPDGLCDMSGNAREIVDTWWTGPPTKMYTYYDGGDFDPPPHPIGNEEWNKITRGGGAGESYIYGQFRCANRLHPVSDIRYLPCNTGFRLAFDSD